MHVRENITRKQWAKTPEIHIRWEKLVTTDQNKENSSYTEYNVKYSELIALVVGVN